MRLRSGRTYSGRYFHRISAPRNFSRVRTVVKNEKMAPPSPSPNNPPNNPPNVPTHTTPAGTSRVTIVTHSAIQPFAGMVNGRMPQAVESFIDSMDAHLRSKGITDDKLSYQEARANLDFVKGDLSDWSRTFSFKVCDSWTGLKALLRQAYSCDIDQDCVLFLRSIIKQCDRKGRSFIRCAAEISDRMIEFIDKLKGTSWVKGIDADGDTVVTIEKLMLLVQLSLITSTLPDRLVALFDVKLDEKSSEITIVDQIKKQSQKLSDLDPTILSSTEKNKDKISTPAVVQRNIGRSFSSGVPNAQSSKGACHNCSRIGHFARECQVQYCSVHNSTKHKYRDCKNRMNDGKFKKNGVRKGNDSGKMKGKKVAPITQSSECSHGNSTCAQSQNFQKTSSKNPPT